MVHADHMVRADHMRLLVHVDPDEAIRDDERPGSGCGPSHATLPVLSGSMMVQPAGSTTVSRCLVEALLFTPMRATLEAGCRSTSKGTQCSRRASVRGDGAVSVTEPVVWDERNGSELGVGHLDAGRAPVRSSAVNGQREFLIGGQQFSLEADSSSPDRRTAEFHVDGQRARGRAAGGS